MRLSRCPAVIMMDVFVVHDPSCSLVSTARPLVASSVPSYNSGSTLWFVLFVWTYCGFCLAVLVSWYYSSTPYDAAGIRFPRLRLLARPDVCKGPWSLRVQRKMAMARASLVRSLLVWLQVLQQPYRMMAPELLREGLRGGVRTRVL